MRLWTAAALTAAVLIVAGGAAAWAWPGPSEGLPDSKVAPACGRPVPESPREFSLTVQEVTTDASVGVTLIAIRTSQSGSISVDHEADHESVLLGDSGAGGSGEGSVALVASRIAPSGDGDVYVQTLIRAQAPGGRYAGGPSTFTLPRDTRLADHFAVTAESGDFPLNVPIEIARLGGKPVTLTVGRPTR